MDDHGCDTPLRSQVDGMERVPFEKRVFGTLVADVQRLVFRYQSEALTEAQLILWLRECVDAMDSVRGNVEVGLALAKAETLVYRDLLGCAVERLDRLDAEPQASSDVAGPDRAARAEGAGC